MIFPKNREASERERRLVVMSEKNPGVYPWLLGTYTVSEETPFDFKSTKDFNCRPARGKTGKDFFIVNHWVRPGGAPDPVEAGTVNSAKTLTARLTECIELRRRLPNFVAVDFTGVGDLVRTVDRYNAAVARRTGVTRSINRLVRILRSKETLSAAELADLDALHRLPRISDEEARELLGPIADTLPPPTGLDRFVQLPPEEDESAPPATTTTVPPPEPSEP
jgi:hypothetical protein